MLIDARGTAFVVGEKLWARIDGEWSIEMNMPSTFVSCLYLVFARGERNPQYHDYGEDGTITVHFGENSLDDVRATLNQHMEHIRDYAIFEMIL